MQHILYILKKAVISITSQPKQLLRLLNNIHLLDVRTLTILPHPKHLPVP